MLRQASGGTWSVRFPEGADVDGLADRNGLSLYNELLRQPTVRIPVLRLGKPPIPDDVPEFPAGLPSIDAQTVQSVEIRILELEQQAELAADEGRMEESMDAKREAEECRRYLNQNRTKLGIAKSEAPELERERKRIVAAFQRARAHLAEHGQASLSRHLKEQVRASNKKIYYAVDGLPWVL